MRASIPHPRFDMSKLIAYFSASGVTARAAKDLATEIGADLYEIAAAPAFSQADLDWTDKNSRCYKEMHDDACRPPLAQPVPDVSGYDEIVIAFPIWWGIEPRQVDTFLDSVKVSGKKFAVLTTSGGSPVGPSVDHLKKLYPDGNWTAGIRVSGGSASSWAKELGL